MYPIISGVTMGALSHSGCKNNLHCGETIAAYCSAHRKSDWLKITTFNSFANGTTSGRGALNFLGDRQIQSQAPLNGCAPDVSILVSNPFSFNAAVSAVRSCINGSPPVITTRPPFMPCWIEGVFCNTNETISATDFL